RTVIRQSIAYAESAERAIPILDYRRERGADYLSLTGEVLRRVGRQDMLAPLDELSAELAPGGPGKTPDGRRQTAEPETGEPETADSRQQTAEGEAAGSEANDERRTASDDEPRLPERVEEIQVS